MINFSVLKNHARVKKCRQGTVIAPEGGDAQFVVVLLGEVGLFRSGTGRGGTPDVRIGPGGFFGESAFVSGGRARHTSVALTDVIALPIDRTAAAAFIREEPELTQEILQALCERLDALEYDKHGGCPPGPQPGAKAEPPAPARKKPAPAPPPAPAAHTKAPAAPAQGFPLFPEGHGGCTLPLNNDDRTYLMDKSHTCPFCKKEFKTLKVRSSKLMAESTDADMRTRYRGVEPLYYDVTTCPHCLYSALAEQFASPDIIRANLKELETLKAGAGIRVGAQMDTFSVFAGYYLALLCAPKCFSNHALSTAKLLLKLSRIYQDCGNAEMEEATAGRALDAYLHIYLNEKSTPEQDQQLCVIIGELYLKRKDYKNARDFFFKAKTSKENAPMLKAQAETRLAEIKEIVAK